MKESHIYCTSKAEEVRTDVLHRFPFSNLWRLLEMLLLAMILLLSVTLGETNPTREYTEDVTPEERVLQVLQQIAARPTPEPLASKLSSHLPMDMSNPWLSARIPSRSWWWHPEKHHPETKRKQNLASYNLNSFGLRYGK